MLKIEGDFAMKASGSVETSEQASPQNTHSEFRKSQI